MAVLSTRQQRAGLLIFGLGAGLVYVLWPYFSGLLGAPVLVVIFGGLHRRLSKSIGRSLAALVVIALSFFLILLPIVGAVTLLANEAGGWARSLTESDLLNRLRGLEFMGVQVGEEIKKFSSSLLSFVGGSALGIVGTGARLLIQFTITFFGLYYLLMDPAGSKALLESFIPFSAENRTILLQRFQNVTVSMLVGTFAVAPDGAVAVYATDGGHDLSLEVWPLMQRNVRYRFVLVYTVPDDQKDRAVADVTAALADGALPVGVDAGLPIHRFPLERAGDAHAAVEAGAVGKVLIDVA